MPDGIGVNVPINNPQRKGIPVPTLNIVNPTVTDALREKYGGVAQSALTNDTAGVRAVAEAFGYTADELAGIPADPFAIYRNLIRLVAADTPLFVHGVGRLIWTCTDGLSSAGVFAVTAET